MERDRRSEPEQSPSELLGQQRATGEEGAVQVRRHISLRTRVRPGVCERCGANLHVHRGLCRRCRKVLLGEGRMAGRADVGALHSADVGRLRNPPWRRRGA